MSRQDADAREVRAAAGDVRRVQPAPRQRLRRALVFASLLLFPVTLNYFSPVLILQGAVKGVVTASALVFAGLFATGLLFGRAFCGWACPGAGMQEPLCAVNPAPVTGQVAGKIKWALWVPWVMAIVTCYALAGERIRFVPLFMTPGGVSVSRPEMFIPYFTVAALMVWLALAVGRRGFCHAACWMAPFLILGARAGRSLRLPRLRLAAREGACDGCGECAGACSMSLDVPAMAASGRTDHPECVLCGECADACPRKALDLRFGAGKAGS